MIVTIYYNSLERAGAENLFISLSRKLIKEGHVVYIYDNEKKIIASNVEESIPLNFRDPLEFTDLLICTMSDVLNWESNVNIKEIKKIIIWNIHPDNIYGILRFGILFQKIFKLLFLASFFIRLFNWRKIKLIKYKLSIPNIKVAFMDSHNMTKFNNLIKIDALNIFLPIAFSVNSSAPQSFSKNYNLVGDDINLLMVGRLVDFKVNPLLIFVKKFSDKTINLNVTIVGDGYLKSHIEATKLPFNVKISIVGNKYGFELTDYVKKNDIAYAMGTAALDLAIYRIPVLLSPMGNESPGACCWLYQTYNYNTAYTKDSPGISWDDILIDLRTRKRDIIDKNYTYAFNNHHIDTIYKKIIMLIS
jgi:hypothetical protein